MKKTATTTKKWAESHGTWVHFTHRDSMRRRKALPGAPARRKAVAPSGGLPSTILPVDCSGNAGGKYPIDGNDTLGICGPAMCDHVNGLRTYGRGLPGFTEIAADLTKLEGQYETVSGGDNGTDEDMLVGASGIWTCEGGGLAGDETAVVVDHLDLDVTDLPLARYCIDQFTAVCMAWSVPDDFLRGFALASTWANADTPDPENGHYSPLADLDEEGFMRLFTWGAWAWVSPEFVASVDPECFVTFSALGFDADGFDSHGRHVSDQAAKWIAIGGDAAAVAPVVSKFPPKPAPAP